jgi:hypothetical protein
MGKPMPSPEQEPSQSNGLAIPKLSQSPIHLLSAIVCISTDKLWTVMLLDMGKTLPTLEREYFYLVSGLLLLLITTLSVTLIQRWVEKENLGMALAKGFALGILAGLPYSFASTELGLVFIAWSGLNELQKITKEIDSPSNTGEKP